MIFYIPSKTKMTEEIICGDTFACKNGSICKAGEGNDIDHRHQHLGLLSSMISDVDGSKYYCECPLGYIGHDCAVEVKECTSQREDLVHSCYFGSECIEADNEYGLLDKFCDCSSAHGDDKVVAGLMCQYSSSAICNDDVSLNDLSTTSAFCTNGGTCKNIVSSDENFSGCHCEEGKWDGKHCEFADGVLKDDALDLFSVRKAEILYEEKLHGLGNAVKATPDESLVTAATTPEERIESESFSYTSFAAGCGVVIGVGISLILTIVVRLVRKNEGRQLLSNDDDDTFDIQVPPPNVFSSSRKKEEEVVNDDESTLMFEPNLAERYEDDVEMLDEATSRILESQFRSSEVGRPDSNEENLMYQSEDFATPPYYDHHDEALEVNGADRPRITVNNGQFLLSSVEDEAHEMPSTLSSVLSLDGDDSVDDGDQTNIVSLDGDQSDDDHDDGASNYQILTYV